MKRTRFIELQIVYFGLNSGIGIFNKGESSKSSQSAGVSRVRPRLRINSTGPALHRITLSLSLSLATPCTTRFIHLKKRCSRCRPPSRSLCHLSTSSPPVRWLVSLRCGLLFGAAVSCAPMTWGPMLTVRKQILLMYDWLEFMNDRGSGN